ncbi:MAG: hypothetical protein OXC00_13755, partial [Acidimicrobiaceae bacterium]|nr:hypothetical protein [Acidimicrobiaceae bacterium]
MDDDDTLEEPETVFEQARRGSTGDPFHDDDTIHAGLHTGDPFHDDDTIHAGLHDDDTIDVDPELLQQALAQARRGSTGPQRRPLLWAAAAAATALAAGLALGWWAAGGLDSGDPRTVAAPASNNQQIAQVPAATTTRQADDQNSTPEDMADDQNSTPEDMADDQNSQDNPTTQRRRHQQLATNTNGEIGLAGWSPDGT